jgi:glycerol kinase
VTSQIADPLIVAIDQGTSSTKALVVDAMGTVVAKASVALGQSHPKPGWVEQDANELFDSVRSAVETAIVGIGDRVVAIGISSQRESAVVWDRETGEPLGPVLGWQDRRTAAEAQSLVADGNGDRVRSSTGLPIDPMFSALKFQWLLNSVDPDRTRARAESIAVGTVDSWLLYRLTGEHRIELGNASRTQLLNLNSADWDDDLLALFDIPRAALPRLSSSNEHSAPVTGIAGLSPSTVVTAVLGDSHAALYGHGAREAGSVKVTYGTGSSIMGILPAGGPTPAGLVRTIAWSTDSPVYAFEGNILSAGSTLVWLAGVLGSTPAALTALAEDTGASDGVSLVPAFAGLGAPWWDDRATAVLTGFDLGTGVGALAVAAVESIALQVEDVLDAADAGLASRIDTILADGGPSSNRWLMQLQADLSQRDVVPSDVAELSALGAAHLAGESYGLWTKLQTLGFESNAGVIHPLCDPEEARERRTTWLSAVARSRDTQPNEQPTIANHHSR